MHKYKRILVATDLGIHTIKLIEKAKSLTDDLEQITLYHVVKPVDVNLFGLLPYIPIMPIVDRDVVEKNVYKTKNKIFSAIAKDSSIKEQQCIIEKGNPKNQITDFAKSNEYDLIIASTRDRNQIKPYLGSTAKAILQNAHCDVLLVDIND